jgi:hypothetical protein
MDKIKQFFYCGAKQNFISVTIFFYLPASPDIYRQVQKLCGENGQLKFHIFGIVMF